ncbi:hypothetical protein E2N92_11660 [Methanofollis formosanus]|uniref:Uncharacterized protein n=1 Tax=Methanofollis formosanus TaxID=299308 RepID=A0A8G1A423_9EURY|nr:hypothetical protein [Methanofollis formosanus]QYZ80034.1 hypothetical protein E2N92_11660 [Methanofollis formosanus]
MKIIQTFSSGGMDENLNTQRFLIPDMRRTKPPSERSILCLPGSIFIPGVRAASAPGMVLWEGVMIRRAALIARSFLPSREKIDEGRRWNTILSDSSLLNKSDQATGNFHPVCLSPGLMQNSTKPIFGSVDSLLKREHALAMV